MLNLICAPSGSGKTEYLIERIRRDVENGERCYLLVPEQQAYISERALLEALPPNAGLYFEVVSFSSLADAVFRRYGGLTSVSADAGISTLLMWDTIRELADPCCSVGNEAQRKKLIRYAKSKRVDGALTALMLATVNELRAGGITPEELEQAALSPDLDPVLAEKLSDVALICSGYHARLENAFGGDPADKMGKLAKILAEHGDFFCGCNVYVDSFTSFTAPEYEVLKAAMSHAKALTVALCADSFNSKRLCFSNIQKTEERLAGLSSKTERIQLPPCKSNGKKPLELRILSEQIWDFSVKRTDKLRIPREERGAVRLLSSNNIYEEAEAAALYICQQIQNGMRYRDVAVIVRDTEVYRGVLDAAFERHGIPYFVSERTDLSAKPLARLLLCALRAAVHDFRRTDVIALLKTGLCGVAERDIAMFEEYCETWHITGSRFKDNLWSMNPDGATTEKLSARARLILESANAVRKRIIPPLESLALKLKASRSLLDNCNALYDYLVATELEANLARLAKNESKKNRAREEAETLRLYDRLIKMLTAVCHCLKDARMEADEFITALSLLLSNTDLGSVPEKQDCVMIGSAATLRVENVRVSLLLGLCEGEFPAAVTDEGVFNDTEKVLLEGLKEFKKFQDFFASKTPLRNAEELFYVYRAIAKPTDALLLSTVKKQTDGSARVPSLAFNRAHFLLKNEKTEDEPAEDPLEHFDVQEVRAARAIPSAPRVCEEITAPPLAPDTVLSLSQSRITTFTQCPYLHYLKYVLGLRDQKDATPTYADDGTFLHYVLERYLRDYLDLDRLRADADSAEVSEDMAESEEKELREIVDTLLEDYVRDCLGGSVKWLGEHVVHQLAHLRHLAILILGDTVAELRHGKFIPAEFEKAIGTSAASALPPVELTLKSNATVRLTGKIDRIDTCTFEDADGKRRNLVRVVDYKTGEHVFSPEDVADGSDIQLVLYLHAYLAAHADTEAYGAQYVYKKTKEGTASVVKSGFHLADETLEGIVPTSDTDETKPQSAEEIDALRMTLQQTVTGIAERILAGEARKTPSEDACKYCTIKDSCDRACHGKE